MPITTTTKPRKRSLLSCLVVCGGLGLIALPGHCQPPPAHTEPIVRAVEQDWQNLRKETGADEFLKPQDSIARYQKFYETEGFRSGQTAVEITNIIAQLYWQGLHDSQKALAVYDWGLKNLDHYPHFYILKRGRAAVADGGKFTDTVNVPADAADTTAKTADNATAVAPVILQPDAKVLLPVTGANPNDQNNATNHVAPIVPAAPPVLGSALSVGINFRQLQLANSAASIRTSKMTVNAFLTSDKPTVKEAVWMLSAPGVIESWKGDKPLRLALVGLIQEQSPDLLQTPETLPQPTQVALAQYYSSLRSPQAEPIYQRVIKQKITSGTWFSRLDLMYDQSAYYEKMEQTDKAAQALLDIQKKLPIPFYIGDTNVAAARIYMRAGETDKAIALYKQTENSTFAWAAGLAMVDQANQLIAQEKYDDAIKVLSQPIAGKYADQMKVGMLSTLGYAYLQKGDVESARRVSQQSVDGYQQLASPLQGEGLQELEGSAEQRVRLIDKWKDSLFVLPLKSPLAKRDDQGVYHTTLYVQSFIKAQPVVVRFDNPAVQLEALTLQKQHRTDQGVIVEKYEITYKIEQHPADLKALVTATTNPKEQQTIDIRYIDEEI